MRWARTGGIQSPDGRTPGGCSEASVSKNELHGGLMPGRALAVANGDELAKAVAQLGRDLGLEPMEQVRVARRIWGAERFIDVVLVHPQTRKTLGLECKFQ